MAQVWTKARRAAFGKKMRLAKARKARGGRKAPAKRKAAKRKATKRRAPARYARKAPAKRRAVRRRKATPEGVVGALASAAIPSVVGIVTAGLVSRALPAANTPIRRAALTGGAAVALAMASKFVARSIPLGVVTARFVSAVAGGMAVDAVFRGTSNVRASIKGLPESARRSGGLLAGRTHAQMALPPSSLAQLAALQGSRS